MIAQTSMLSALALACGLAACATAPDGKSAAKGKAPDAYAGKSVVDVAINAAGGTDALAKVKEIAWTGSATVNAGGKTTELLVDTQVRPFTYARSTSWPKAEGAKGKGERSARTLQIDASGVSSVAGYRWDSLPEAQRINEQQQYALYGLMTLTPLKDPSAKITEQPKAADGTRTVHVEYPKAQPTDLTFDGAGKLVKASYSVRDPAGGAALIPQVVDFSGEVASNGVKWPKHIAIKQNGTPFFELEIDSFEARAQPVSTVILHTLGDQSHTPAPQKPE